MQMREKPLNKLIHIDQLETSHYKLYVGRVGLEVKMFFMPKHFQTPT